MIVIATDNDGNKFLFDTANPSVVIDGPVDPDTGELTFPNGSKWYGPNCPDKPSWDEPV